MAQWVVPSADVTDGGWATQAGSQVDLFDQVNEDQAAISDADYIQSSLYPIEDPVRLLLSTPAYPPGSGTLRLWIRAAWIIPAATGTDVAFVWDAVVDATRYVLLVGPAPDTYTTFNADVGNYLTHTLNLDPGTYHSRVQAWNGAILLDTTAEQDVTV